jgi:hypothetical protein
MGGGMVAVALCWRLPTSSDDSYNLRQTTRMGETDGQHQGDTIAVRERTSSDLINDANQNRTRETERYNFAVSRLFASDRTEMS